MALFLLCAASCQPAGAPETAAGTEAAPDLTIMIYMVGSDLESENGAASSDLAEIRAAGAALTRTNVLVLTGGSLQWQSDVAPDANTTYLLTEGRWETVASAEVRNMGEAETLSEFLRYGCTNYPAGRYALILWDHGGGPVEGYGYDERHAFDHLTLPEMRQAMQNSPFGSGKRRLAWIGFDACLMSSVETASVFTDYTDYMIASQEAVPNQGWDYGFLTGADGMLSDGAVASRRIIDAYAACYEAQNAQLANGRKTVTLSCLDLRQMPAVEAALDALSVRLDTGILRGDYSDIAKKRSDTRAFGRYTLGRQFDLIDLGELARQFAGEAPEECAALTDALGRLVVYQRSNQEQTGGVSIFFPYDNATYFSSDAEKRFAWQDVYAQLGFAPEYAAFLYRFAKTQSGERLTDWSGVSAPAPQFDEKKGEYYLQLTPEQAESFDKAQFYIIGHVSGGEYIPYLSSLDTTLDADGRLRANFDNRAFYIVQGEERALPLVLEDEIVGDITRYHTNVTLQRWNEDDFWGTYEAESASLQFERNTATGAITVTGAIPFGESGDADRPRGKREIQFSDWGTVSITSRGRYLTCGENGEMLPFHEWESSGTSRGWEFETEGGFSVQYLPLEDVPWDLYCTITVRDVQGNLYCSPLTPVVRKGEEPPDVERPPDEPVFARYPIGGEEEKPLLSDGAISLTLTGLHFDATMRDLTLTLRANNEGAAEASVALEDACVGAYRFQTSASAKLSAGAEQDCTLRFPLAHSLYAPNLQDYGITDVREISFRLSYEIDGGVTSSRMITIGTAFDPAPYYVAVNTLDRAPISIDPQILYDVGGVRLSLSDAYFTTAEGMRQICLPVTLENADAPLGGVRIEHISINGVQMDDISGNCVFQGPIRAGVCENGRMCIDMEKTLALGIDTMESIGFSIAIYDEDKACIDRQWRVLTPTVSTRLTLIRMSEPSHAQEDGARILLDRDGVRLTQLPGLTPGTFSETILIENNTPLLMTLSAQDCVVNGEIPVDFLLFASEIAPGNRMYAPLSFRYEDALAGEKSITRVSLRLLGIDSVRNTLAFRTDSIELTFQGETLPPQQAVDG